MESQKDIVGPCRERSGDITGNEFMCLVTIEAGDKMKDVFYSDFNIPRSRQQEPWLSLLNSASPSSLS